MRRRPHRIDLVHPILHLAQCMVGIATARPMAERHRGRDASLARIDDTAVFGCEPAEVEYLDLEIRLGSEDDMRQHGEPPGLRALARARVLAAGCAIDQKDA